MVKLAYLHVLFFLTATAASTMTRTTTGTPVRIQPHFRAPNILRTRSQVERTAICCGQNSSKKEVREKRAQ